MTEDGEISALRQAMLDALVKKAGNSEVSLEGPKKIEDGKLLYRAEKLGGSWSKWINTGRPKHWQTLDQRMVNDWITLAVQIVDIEQETGSRVVARIAKGMGLLTDAIRKGSLSDDNKVAYMFEGIDSNRSHLIIGINRLFLSHLNVPAGGFFLASLAHLSEFKAEDRSLKLLKSCLVEQLDVGGKLSLQDTYLLTSNWISHPEVRDYFAERRLIGKLF